MKTFEFKKYNHQKMIITWKVLNTDCIFETIEFN
jgi:hypothetical protein